MTDLRGRTAVVTGVASGIGQALALALDQEGCKLALVDVHTERLAEVTATIPGASVHTVDVSDRDAMLALPDQVIAAHGAVHLVINNAGVSCSLLFEEHTLADWDWIIGINLWGVVHGCHAFLPHLMAQDWGHIVNVSSLFGIVGVPTQASYSATRYAVRGISEAVLLDWLKRLFPVGANRWAARLISRALGLEQVHQARIAEYEAER